MIVIGKGLSSAALGGFENKSLKPLPISSKRLATCWVSANEAASICSLFNFFASFNFIPLLLRLEEASPSASVLISPGPRGFPGVEFAMLSQSVNSSPASSASAFLIW